MHCEVTGSYLKLLELNINLWSPRLHQLQMIYSSSSCLFLLSTVSQYLKAVSEQLSGLVGNNADRDNEQVSHYSSTYSIKVTSHLFWSLSHSRTCTEGLGMRLVNGRPDFVVGKLWSSALSLSWGEERVMPCSQALPSPWRKIINVGVRGEPGNKVKRIVQIWILGLAQIRERPMTLCNKQFVILLLWLQPFCYSSLTLGTVHTGTCWGSGNETRLFLQAQWFELVFTRFLPLWVGPGPKTWRNGGSYL